MDSQHVFWSVCFSSLLCISNLEGHVYSFFAWVLLILSTVILLSCLNLKSFIVLDKMLTCLNYFIFLEIVYSKKKSCTLLFSLYCSHILLSSRSQPFSVWEREQFLFRLFPFLIASDFLASLPGSCSKLCCCGVAETGIGCILIAITTLTFVIFHVSVCW